MNTYTEAFRKKLFKKKETRNELSKAPSRKIGHNASG